MNEADAVNPFCDRESYLSAVDSAARITAERASMAAAYFRVFSGEDGERVLEHLCRTICGEGTSCFASDALDMARKAGMQEAALMIRGFVERGRAQKQQVF